MFVNKLVYFALFENNLIKKKKLTLQKLIININSYFFCDMIITLKKKLNLNLR